MDLFRELSLGITNQDLNTIPISPDAVRDDKDSDGDGYSDRSEVLNGYNPFVPSDPANRGNDKVTYRPATYERLKGKILLATEDHGRIWYVDQEGKRWEVTWENAMNLFTSLALGIDNEDLDTILGDE